MNRLFLRILFAIVAVSRLSLWSVRAAEGSWFDGMDFEEYHPSGQQAENETNPSSQIAWRIPCGLVQDGPDRTVHASILPLSTVIDLNRPTSTIEDSFLQSTFDKEELSTLLVQDQNGNGTHIPSESLWLRMGSIKATVLAPKLEVVMKVSDNAEKENESLHGNENSIQLRLGMDFVSMYQGRLDVEGAGGLFITVPNQQLGGQVEEVLIPVWQSRSPIDHDEL